MLFNTYHFIFAFLPVTLLVFFLLGSRGQTQLAMGWLVVASLFFYGFWNPAYVVLIVLSLLVNFAFGRALIREGTPPGRRKALLWLGVGLNLSLLAYYKYANFFVDNVNRLAGTSFHLETIVLPLAISFFTFQQIAFVVDAYQGKAQEPRFLPYCLFVTFFPQLIAGPIVHHGEMMPQFLEKHRFRFQSNAFAIGLTIFLLGLFKKVIIADEVAAYASAAFAGADSGLTLTFFEAWTASLSYAMQIYFDFSGYSDMAIGLGRMFGIKLPMNFNSPYKATSIVEFWRRWHMTLSRFLRDYLYIPLGGNRKGPTRQQINLLLTMLLGGLWHGAGWNFIIWGGLHGLYLIINHHWRAWRQPFREQRPVGWFFRLGYGGLTFVAVMIAWSFFRATTFDGAIAILRGMFGFNGISMPDGLATALGSLATATGGWIHFEGIQQNAFPIGVPAALWALGAAAVAFLAPNVCQIMHRFEPAFETYPGELKRLGSRWLTWHPSTGWAVAVAVLGFWTFANLTRVSEFLYFQF